MVYKIKKQLISKNFLVSNIKKGFTLAEVLVVITIVGIIACQTIPDLVYDIQTDQYKTAYKKAFADASQAWISAYNDDVLLSQSGWASNANNNTNFNTFMSRFNVVKQCTSATRSQCWYHDIEGDTSWWEPWGFATGGYFIDNSGRAWGNKDYPYIAVDTNGFKGPNRFGKDRWPLFVQMSNTWNASGIPTTINPWTTDYTAFNANACYYPPCYYKSWLTGIK